MSSNRIVVYGAGGHAKVMADAARAAGADVVALVDDDPTRQATRPLDIPVRPIAWLASQRDLGVALGVGDNRARESIAGRLLAAGHRLATVIHPRAVVAASARLGEGTFVAAGAVVNPDASIGRGVIVNTSAVVEHDVVVGDFAHVSPAACLAGGAQLGALAHLGAGATVLPRIMVGARSVVGGGALVNRAIPEDVVAYGVPARVRRDRP
jgi:sugar O-acyltransferase (sialic acid O-acetyltransferase NeuD family)